MTGAGFLPAPLRYGEDMAFTEEEKKYMRIALSQAAKGKGMAHPNPMVGAVMVKNGNIICKDYHRGPYTPHAEAAVLAKAGEDARGADLYVTLEPCNHQGRTPPCSEAIIRAGVKRVLYAAGDPNPSVKGGGARRLLEAGLQVKGGLLEERARELNAAYEKYVVTGIPLVTLKVAATADGRVAARGGASRWITGEKARRLVHVMRRECDAVLVGSGTVASDDPELTVRMAPLRGANRPLRVVVDSRLSIDPSSKLASGGEPGVLIATTEGCDRDKAQLLADRGVEVLILGEREGRVDLEELLKALGEREVVHLLVEGGPVLFTSFLEKGLADRLALFMAPKVFGDELARSWAEGRSVEDLSRAIHIVWRSMRRVGEDILIEADMQARE